MKEKRACDPSQEQDTLDTITVIILEDSTGLTPGVSQEYILDSTMDLTDAHLVSDIPHLDILDIMDYLLCSTAIKMATILQETMPRPVKITNEDLRNLSYEINNA